MLARLTAVALLLATASASSCTSLASLVKGNSNSPPSGLGVPDCAYITQHASTICFGLGAWDIVNSDTCYLKASGYGCLINSGLFNTQDTFYCQLGVAAQPTESATATVTVSASSGPSPSTSASSSASATATASSSSSSSATATASASSLATASATASATATATATQTPTPSITPSASPSMNVTLVYITAAMNDGEKAAIGLSAIFGFCILFLCCGACVFMLRRKSPEPALSIKLPPSRRASTVEKAPSRRTSMVAVSEPQEPQTPKTSIRRNSIIEKTVSKKLVTIRTVN